MTPPTLQEFAGIFMLALVAAGFIANLSTGSHAAQAPMTATAAAYTNTIPIDGIEAFAPPTRKDSDRIR